VRAAFLLLLGRNAFESSGLATNRDPFVLLVRRVGKKAKRGTLFEAALAVVNPTTRVSGIGRGILPWSNAKRTETRGEKVMMSQSLRT
jgi:hypothetical protein